MSEFSRANVLPVDRLPEAIHIQGRATHLRVAEVFFAVWAVVMPLHTFAVVPQIPGTIPAYLLAFASVPLCLKRKYWSLLLMIVMGWLCLLMGSQVGLLASGTREHLSLYLMEPNDPTPVFRRTLWTQSLYLLACVFIFLYVKTYYTQLMLRYVFWGAWFFVIYGLFDWAYVTVTGQSGDFLANRVIRAEGGDEHLVSWSQYFSLGSVKLLRLKGMTEEPSRYATLTVAYLALSITNHRRWLSIFLLISLFLSTSLTGFLGLSIMFGVLTMAGQSSMPSRRLLVSVIALAVVGMVGAYLFLPELFDEILLSRIRGEHQSAQNRLAHLINALPVFWNLPVLNKIFGVGFGTCFLPTSLQMLVNCGLIGLGVFIAFICYPIVRLSHSHEDLGLVAALVGMAFIYSFISAGIYVPTIWMLLGMAYARVAVIQTSSAVYAGGRL